MEEYQFNLLKNSLERIEDSLSSIREETASQTRLMKENSDERKKLLSEASSLFELARKNFRHLPSEDDFKAFDC